MKLSKGAKRRRHMEEEYATYLGEELGLNDERGVSREVALAENLEVTVGSDIDDRHLLLGGSLQRTTMRKEDQ